MYRIRPDYYEHFTCIADHCPITCCQEWKIAVDADTNRKWNKNANKACTDPFYLKFGQNTLSKQPILLIPGGTLEDMLIQMQWIAMEYSVIRHSLFLKWLIDSPSGAASLQYETVRDYLVIISRMTGYEEADIYEYLENSFESLIWDWGYFALIIGKK